MPIILETERLFLRQMDESDAEGLFLLNSDPEVTQYTGDGPYADVDEAKTFIKEYDQYEKYKMGRLSVFLKETNEYLGWCGLKFHPNADAVDLGYRFFKRKWGKGYATETSIASLNYGFNTLDLQKIVAHAMIANPASVNVMKKLGMIFSHNDTCASEPSVVYAITKDQWK